MFSFFSRNVYTTMLCLSRVRQQRLARLPQTVDDVASTWDAAQRLAHLDRLVAELHAYVHAYAPLLAAASGDGSDGGGLGCGASLLHRATCDEFFHAATPHPSTTVPHLSRLYVVI